MNVLLASVFKPYGVDDEFGRADNKMELFHNQVTREQGVFSMRMSHHSGGLHLIASNIKPAVRILDFPTMAEFEQEIRSVGYDIIGISFIVPNALKAAHMVKRIRALSPRSRVVVGGHGAAIDDVVELVRADDICRGEGVRWFRDLLGEEPSRPLVHPVLDDAVDRRILGMPVPSTGRVFMPGVGCPNRCNFCSTSHFFGGRHHPFWSTGSELYDQLRRIERPGSPTDFWVLDENFLKFEDRVRDLAEIVAWHRKPWSFGLFSSAEAVNRYEPDFLVRMGVRFIWLGMESTVVPYPKNQGIDFRELIQRLQSRGVSVLISTILFLEEHDRQSLKKDVDSTIGLESDLIQFMQLGAPPGTPLYRKFKSEDKIRDISYIEWHGQGELPYKHPVFSPPETHRLLIEAFRSDFHRNGPSILRIAHTYLKGHEHLKTRAKGDPVLEMRLRLAQDRCRKSQVLLPACVKLAPSAEAREKAIEVQARYREAFGGLDPIRFALSQAVLAAARLEDRRIREHGDVLQPTTQRTSYRFSRS